MKKFFLVATTCFYLLFSAGFGQSPVITSSDFNPIPGESFLFHLFDGSSVSPGSTGANVAWDFSSVSSTGTSSSLILDPALTPYAASFPLATDAVESSTGSGFYAYYIGDANKYSRYGAANPSSTTVFQDQEDFLRYPMTFNTTYTDPFSSQFVSGGITFFRFGDVTVTGEGYGTLTLSSGTYSGVLKVKIEEDYKDSADIGGFPYIIQYNSTSDWWLLPGGTHNVLFGINQFTTTPGSTVWSGFYLDAANVGTNDGFTASGSLDLFPNPASGSASLSFTLPHEGDVQIEVTDLAGNVAQRHDLGSFTAGGHRTELGVSELPAGVYFVSVFSGESSVVKKLIVQ